MPLSRRSPYRIIIPLLLCGFATSATAQDASALFQRTAPSIVSIETDTGSGTGFFVDGGKYIVTCAHVIEDSNIIRIKGSNKKVTTVAHLDLKKDIAILTVDRQNGTSLTLQSDLPKIGSQVYAIGYSLGQLQNSISDGIVSGIRNEAGAKLIQFTAPISPGSSGGPLISRSGQVVGMTMGAIESGQNLNFAVIATDIKSALEVAKRNVSQPAKAPTQALSKSDKSLIVVGRLGQVIAAGTIHSGPTLDSHVYSETREFQYLVVTKTSDPKWLGVRLVNGKTGYILSDSVAVLPYEVTVPKSGGSQRVTPSQEIIFNTNSPSGKVAQLSHSLLGKPYVHTGKSLSSGVNNAEFVRLVFKEAIGFELPGKIDDQMTVGVTVDRLEDLEPADRLFFSKESTSDFQTGIFLGYFSNGKALFVIASQAKGKVVLEDLADPRWRSILVGSRRSHLSPQMTGAKKKGSSSLPYSKTP